MSNSIDFSSDSETQEETVQKVPKQQEVTKAEKYNIPPEAVQIKKVPTDIVFLPSKGFIYPKEGALFNRESIEVKQMTAAEEDILTSRHLLRTGKAIDMLIRNSIIDRSINSDDLLGGDKDAIMIGLRIGAYGPEYNVDISCPQCEEISKDYLVDLTQLEVKELDESWIEEKGVNQFTSELPSGNVILFKLLSSKEEREVSTENDNFKKHIHTQVDRLVSLRHQKRILAVNGDDNRSKVNDFVKTMSARDSRYLNKVVDQVRPEVKMEINFECSYCGYLGREVVPIDKNFFWPD